jgi:hypothetical protein
MTSAWRVAIAGLVLSAASVLADPPALEVPAELRPAGQYAELAPKTDAASVVYVGLDGVDPIPARVLKDPTVFLLDTRGLAAGRYRFAAVAASRSGEQTRRDFVLVVGDAPGPGPGPAPRPPDPAPQPPPPIPGNGLRVLVVYESADLARYPPGQLAVLYAKAVRDYLNTHCPPGPDGRTREWRIYDQDTDTSGESKTWQDAMRRPRASLPWIVVSNGRTGYEGPLPASVADTLALLRKYGGE